jgi:hypothetical protein
MDTRKKIVTVDEITGEGWVGIAGLFDPLTVEQAERIAALVSRVPDRKLLAVITPASGTLLSAEARAALVAGLREVRAVVIAEPDTVRARGIEINEDQEGEARRSSEFVEFVLARQRSK